MTELEPHEFVLNLEHAVWQAVVWKDGAALGQLLADNYIEITLDGRRVEKSDTINESPHVDEIDGYVIDAEKVVWLGEDRAILSYRLTLDGRCRGVTISPRVRWATSIWSRFDNKWLCCFFQQSAFVAEHNDRSLPLPSSLDEPVEMVANDCAEVLAFWRDMPGVGLSDADTPEGLSSFLRRNPDLSLVVRRDGRIAGAVLCGHDGRRGYLHHLAVTPDLRRQGLGQALVERCLKKLGSLGIQKCNIFVYADNDGTGFWRRSGWLDLKVMQRPLSVQHSPSDH